MQLPNSASLQRTEEVMKKLQEVAREVPGVEHVTTISGFSLLSLVRTSYSGFGFISMKEWGDRKTREQQFQEIKTRLNAAFSELPGAVAFGFSPPAIPGVGTSGGFTFILEDRSGGDVKFLLDVCASSRTLRSLLVSSGHDAISAIEVDPTADDEQVLSLAHREGRILITLDRAFWRIDHPSWAASLRSHPVC